MPVRHQPAIGVEQTGDSKLTISAKHHPLHVTHVAQSSCSVSCPFRFRRDANGNIIRKPNGDPIAGDCYAEHGTMAWVTARLNKAARDTHPISIAMLEAIEIMGLSGHYDCRLHGVGDCNSNPAAMIVADACRRKIADVKRKLRRLMKFWTYTHSWRWVFRSSWGPIAVLASCETANDVRDATRLGYPAALVRDHSDLSPIDGMKAIACPQQTGKKDDCYSCMLCALGDQLHGKAFIQFSPEGQQYRKQNMLRTLATINS